MRRCFVGWRFAYPTWGPCGLLVIDPLARLKLPVFSLSLWERAGVRAAERTHSLFPGAVARFCRVALRLPDLRPMRLSLI